MARVINRHLLSCDHPRFFGTAISLAERVGPTIDNVGNAVVISDVSLQPFHPADQIGSGRLEQEMIVIAHQHPRLNPPTRPAPCFRVQPNSTDSSSSIVM